MTASIAIAAGPRAAEALLVDDVARAANAREPGAAALAVPLRVIVPSGSLRDHVAGRLVAHRGALAGIRVQTLAGAAHEILERAGEARRPGDALFPVLVRRAARNEPALRKPLDSLVDGYAAVVSAVSDLLDAGLEPAQTAALLARVRGREAGETAGAVLRVAARTGELLREADVERHSDRLARAAAILRREGAAGLPAHATWIHGFAEATGRASSLLEALVETLGARVLIDHPPSPVDPAASEPASAFTERLVARLARHAPRSHSPETAGPSAVGLIRAPGAHAEVRAVAERIRSLLDGGAKPHRIGVVARQLESYALPLRQHFARLGLPFSAPEHAGPPLAAGRRVRALLELLRQGEQTPVDRWLDATGFVRELGSRVAREPRRSMARADLSLGLHALGAGRLRDVADLDIPTRLRERESLALPVRRGLRGGSGADDAPRMERRQLARVRLEAAVAHARAVCQCLHAARAARSPAAHLAALRALLEQDLGWSPAVPGHDALYEVLDALAPELPEACAIDAREWLLLLERACEECGHARFGGSGAGVQVLDVTQARARSFEHLFLLGMNRDVFPRTISEDPLLPDALRAALAEALPEIPLKRRGYQEEAYLFAQLLDSSPQVVLCWQRCDDESRPRNPSSLVVRLRLARPDLELVEAPSLWSPRADSPLRPAHEEAVLAGLAGDDDLGQAAVAISLRIEQAHEADPARVLAAARSAVRHEYEARDAELGPYFGLIGPAGANDPRVAELYVTTLEGYGRCPWQAFLRRFLRVEATPDALDALPALGALLLGKAVHGALEAIALRTLGQRPETLEELADCQPQAVPWPDARSCDALLAEAARDALLEEGVELPGMTRALASRARPYLEAAKRLVWDAAAGRPQLLGVEVTGTLPVSGRASVRFRADLVEKTKAGLLLLDYKTGQPLSTAARADKRREQLRLRVAAATHLQALAYRLGAGGKDDEGGYLFLQPGLAPEHAVVRIGRDDDLEAVFRATVETLLAGIEHGSFVPRLVDAALEREPRSCEWCEVAEACVRGDSGARARLVRWAERADGDPALGPARAVLRLDAAEES